MKKTIIKYRSVVVMFVSLVFNLISSLLKLIHGEASSYSMSLIIEITGWVGLVIFMLGMVMMLFDCGRNQREQIEQGCENGVNKFRELIKEIDGQDKDNS